MGGFSSFRYRKALASPLFWACVGLSALPPELLGWVFGWGAMDPAGTVFNVLWWPADVFGRLAALRLLLVLDAGPGTAAGPWRGAWPALGSALAAEILVTLRAVGILFLGLMPCLLLFSLSRPTALLGWPLRSALFLLAFSGLLPAAAYLLRRVLSPLELLRAPLSASQALDASAVRMAWGGPLWRFLGFAWPWIALSWALEGAGLCLSESVACVLVLPSAAAALIPLALAADLSPGQAP